MTDIDVPDWVVEDACKNAWPQFRSGMETEIWEFADAARRDRLRVITREALCAALSAWVVSLIRAAEEEVERRPLSTHTLRAALTALRQEKPDVLP